MRRVNVHALRRALKFEIEGQRIKWKPKRTWNRQVEEESLKVDISKEDELCRPKWIISVNQIGCWVEVI